MVIFFLSLYYKVAKYFHTQKYQEFFLKQNIHISKYVNKFLFDFEPVILVSNVAGGRVGEVHRVTYTHSLSTFL